ncbi:glutathionylspermidine synthase family protein [Exiguobacterium sp. TDN 0502]|uniref:glutathionylspermidine synthase family protein n=1 Tax=Exiguobacterium sp. TDN 0502 TaxID=3420731 RepID=UPI003D76E357
MNERQAFYGDIDRFWDVLDGEPYAVTEIMPVSEERIHQLHAAAGEVYRIFEKVLPILREMDDQALQELGFPLESLAFLRLETMRPLTVIGRFDFIATADRISLMEWNADTPTFIKEVFEVNDVVAVKQGFKKVNDGENKWLKAAVRRAIEAAMHRTKEQPHVVFTSHGDHIEDRLTAEYLQSFWTGAAYCPLHDLEIRPEEGLYDDTGRRIDILYRQTFPIEMALLDRDEAGRNLGQLLLQLVEMGKLEIINPPSAFLMQAKSILALIWMLHESEHPYLTSTDHATIARYFLPTYLSAEPFRISRQPYVKKPIFGREGDTVTIHNGEGDVWLRNEQHTFQDQPAVYQAYRELPVYHLKEEGEVAYMYGVFVLGGRPSAIGVRAGERITGNRSYFVPIGQQQERGGYT